MKKSSNMFLCSLLQKNKKQPQKVYAATNTLKIYCFDSFRSLYRLHNVRVPRPNWRDKVRLKLFILEEF